MKISVIIPTKDRKNDLLGAIKSLLKQTRKPDELIVVDSSKVDCREQITKLWGGENFIYIHTNYPSLTNQRNIGVEKSSGDIVIFLDDDVILHPRFIENIIAPIEGDPSSPIAAVAGKVVPFGETPRDLSKRLLLHRIFLLGGQGSGRLLTSGFADGAYYLCNRGKFVEFLPGGASAIRKQVFQFARFDENLAGVAIMEDIDFSRQIVRAGYMVYFEPRAILWHRASEKEGFNKIDNWHMRVVNHFYCYRKHLQGKFVNKVAFWWSIFGLFFVAVWYMLRSLFKKRKGGTDLLRGFILGIKDIITYSIPPRKRWGERSS